MAASENAWLLTSVITTKADTAADNNQHNMVNINNWSMNF